MKILSVTRDDGRVVELTRQEWNGLLLLAEALEGKTESEAHWDFNGGLLSTYVIGSGYEFKGVFGAINAFAQAKFRTSEIKQLLYAFENLIAVEDGER